MRTYAEFNELEVEIEEILKGKDHIKIDEICIDLGIVKDRINMMLRRYVCHILRKNGWMYSSVYNKTSKRSEKVWVNRKRFLDLDYLRGKKDSVE